MAQENHGAGDNAQNDTAQSRKSRLPLTASSVESSRKPG